MDGQPIGRIQHPRRPREDDGVVVIHQRAVGRVIEADASFEQRGGSQGRGVGGGVSLGAGAEASVGVALAAGAAGAEASRWLAREAASGLSSTQA